MIAEYERAQIAERFAGKRHRAAGSINVLSGAPTAIATVKKTDTSAAYYEVSPRPRCGVHLRCLHAARTSLGAIAGLLNSTRGADADARVF